MNSITKSYFKFYQIFIVFILLCGCKRTDNYNIVTFKGKGAAFNISKSGFFLIAKSDSLKTSRLMAGENDMLFFEDNMVIYKSENGNDYNLFSDSVFSYINNQLYTVYLAGGGKHLPFFMQLKDAEIKNLKFLYFKDTLTEFYKPLLMRLSKVNPHVGCIGNLSQLKVVLKYLQPEVVVLEEIKSQDIDFLENLKSVHTLQFTLSGNAINSQLPSIPSLITLFVNIESNDHLINKDFLKKNSQLINLSVWFKDNCDISFIEPLHSIKSFSITSTEKITGISCLKNNKKLESLCLNGVLEDSLCDFNSLRNLRWISFPFKISQGRFVAFIKEHPNMEVIAIPSSALISDFSPLTELKYLKSLSIVDSLSNYQSLFHLKQLELLTVPREFSNDKIKMEELKKALPNCKIVTNEGFCLGSGWFLLLIPFIIILIIMLPSATYEKQR